MSLHQGFCYCTVGAVVDESSKLRRQFVIAGKRAHAGVEVEAGRRCGRAQRRVTAGAGGCSAAGFAPFAGELTGAAEDRLLLSAPLLGLRTLGQPSRPNGEVQQPQGMLGVRVAFDNHGVLSNALHQGPRRLRRQSPQLCPGLNGDLQPFQDGAFKGQRGGAAVTLDGLLDVDAEDVRGLFGLGGARLGLVLV